MKRLVLRFREQEFNNAVKEYGNRTRLEAAIKAELKQLLPKVKIDKFAPHDVGLNLPVIPPKSVPFPFDAKVKNSVRSDFKSFGALYDPPQNIALVGDAPDAPYPVARNRSPKSSAFPKV